VRGQPIPALLAGQVLEHLTSHPTPTRAEICALYDALHDGYAGVVLSDETAIGRYPLESVRAAALFRERRVL
jgi:pyruvate kinase